MALLARPPLEPARAPERPQPEPRHRYVALSIPALLETESEQAGTSLPGRVASLFMALTALSIIGTAVAVALAR